MAVFPLYRRGATALALTGALVAGCATPGAVDTVTAQGRIAQGVECPLLLTDDGTTYALTSAAPVPEPGTPVRVRGHLAEVSICQQGSGTIQVSSIARL